ncbi:MAG: hypothetical protein AB7G12_12645 [Thermoanaerobaculia bacterium]
MMTHPPKCSAEWTADERLALIEWLTGICIDRILADNPNMPVLAKANVLGIFQAIQFVTKASVEDLEKNRAALEKPYDSSQNIHAGWIVGNPHFLLAQLGQL